MLIGQIFKAGLLIILFFCALSDVRTNRIPNRLTAEGLILAFLYQIMQYGWDAAALSLFPAAICVLAMLPLTMLRMFGAGDIKLLSVVVVSAGMEGAFTHLLYIFLTGAAMSLYKMIRYRNLRRRLCYLKTYLMTAAVTGEAGIYDTESRNKEILLPFAVPVLAGTVITAAAQIL